MPDFNGFPKQLPQFFAGLEKHNTVQWFQDHKKDYETHVKYPSEMFVSCMGEVLKKDYPGINAIPKVNKSLFRLNRDIRFSHDKSPYKTNLGILFWNGPGKRMESASFYFHVEDNWMMVGCGMYQFPKPELQAFRDAVTDNKKGKALKKAVETVRSRGYETGTRHYKKIPAGFNPTTDLEKEYLLYNGLSAQMTMDIPELFYSSDIVDFVHGHFKAMHPIFDWVSNSL